MKKIIGHALIALLIVGILAGLALICMAKGASLTMALASVGIAVLVTAVIGGVVWAAVTLIYS